MRILSSSPASRSSTPRLIGAWLCVGPAWTRYARPGHAAMANAAALPRPSQCGRTRPGTSRSRATLLPFALRVLPGSHRCGGCWTTSS